VLNFLYVAVSWVLLRWHQLLGAIGLDPDSGLTWALSIVLLVITARLLLFRMFVKQVHYQRNMQKMQPKIKKLREKYKDDRAELNRQMMKFQQEEGFNPVAGCLPMFLQIPVFLGLYHVLRHLSNSVALCDAAVKHPQVLNNHLLHLYTFSSSETCSGAKANLFGAPLAASFRDNADKVTQLGGDISSTRWVILPLLIVSAVATLVTQLMVKANATVAPEGTAATIQRVMLWIIPVGVLASGLLFNFPLGVLLYWFTSNLWTLAQQAYIIRFHPPTDEPEKPVGELGKTLAPRPGQRPVRMAKGKPGAADEDLVESSASAAKAESTPAGRTSAPRPGQRPNRPNGKRPPAKRPTQAKKRR
jgi:YidC/Oxa1 family membrane protein insertase